jgi:hypothetical protein
MDCNERIGEGERPGRPVGTGGRCGDGRGPRACPARSTIRAGALILARVCVPPTSPSKPCEGVFDALQRHPWGYYSRTE